MARTRRPKNRHARWLEKTRKPVSTTTESESIHHALRRRAHHALNVLEPLGLKGTPLRECTVALAQLGEHMQHRSLAESALTSFPYFLSGIPRNDPERAKKIAAVAKKSPRLAATFLKADARLLEEDHYYNVRFFKLVLELGAIHPGEGEALAKRAIQQYEVSFLPHAK